MPHPKRMKSNRAPKRTDYNNTERADAAALVKYLTPTIHLLQQLDYMSFKLVALVISDLCETHDLEVPALIGHYLDGRNGS